GILNGRMFAPLRKNLWLTCGPPSMFQETAQSAYAIPGIAGCQLKVLRFSFPPIWGSAATALAQITPRRRTRGQTLRGCSSHHQIRLRQPSRFLPKISHVPFASMYTNTREVIYVTFRTKTPFSVRQAVFQLNLYAMNQTAKLSF